MHNVETRAKRFNSDCAILNKLFREYMDIAAEKLKSTSQWNLRKLSIHLLTNFTDFSGKTYRTKPTMWGARIALFVLTLMAWVSDLMPNWGALVSLAIAYIMTGGHYTFYLLWHTGMRDARGAYRYLRLLVLVYYYKTKDFTVPQVFARTVPSRDRWTPAVKRNSAPGSHPGGMISSRCRAAMICSWTNTMFETTMLELTMRWWVHLCTCMCTLTIWC